MRGGAFVTMPISALDLENRTVFQWPELGVHTKNSKKATTFLLNIPELLAPVHHWDSVVRQALPSSSSWYTPIENHWGDQKLSRKEPGKCRLHGFEKRLKTLFALADLEFKSPHKFRHGHAVYGLLHAKIMADYKAVSMNLMHDSIEITDSTYAPMLSSDVQKRISKLSAIDVSTPEGEELHADSDIEAYLSSLGKESLGRALVYIAGKLTQ
jgi:integrase